MSSRGLIISMLVTGGAQVANIVISIIRMKVLALLLGPTGIGLFSLFSSLKDIVAVSAGLGLESSGVRQIATDRDNVQELSRVRRVLVAAHLVQGGLALLGVWLLRRPLSVWLMGDDRYATEVGLVGIAVLLTLLSVAQTALLQGLRRIADLGRVTVLGALLGTVTGLGAVWLFGQAGLIWFLLAQPFGTALVALYFTRRLPPPTTGRPSLVELWRVWKPMASLGAVFMLGGLATPATLIVVRSWITRDLGLDAAGQFAAAWGISMTYVGFLLTAMAADYYPRLTETIKDRAATARLMNDQTQLGLAIGGPVLLLLIGLAPWVIQLLYSEDFMPAVTLLQWQTVGNVFKLASWPMAFALIAGGRSKVFLATEISWCLLFLAIFWLGVDRFGLNIAGVAFLAAYIAYIASVGATVRRLHGFRWERLSVQLMGTHAMLAFGLLALSLSNPIAGGVASMVLAGVTGLAGLRVVVRKIGSEGRLASRITRLYARVGWQMEQKDD